MPLLGSRGAASTTGFGALANLGYFLRNSLRFRASNSAYLNRTFSAGNRTLFTFSAWVKRGSLTGNQNIFGPDTNTTGSGTYGVLRFVDGTLEAFDYTNGTSNWYLATTSVYRDPAAWYHIVMTYDSAQGTSSNRVKLYVNGTQVTALGTANYPTSSYQGQWNNNLTHYLGTAQIGGSNQYFDGYMAEVNFVDGQALTPSSFGKTDAVTNQWVPKKFGGAYGTNGFYLKFDDSSAVGKDSSGNGNNWSTSGHSVTPGVTYDLMTDVPTLTNATTANYATLNPLEKSNGAYTFSNANLNVSGSGGVSLGAGSTMAVSSGKWYWEQTITAIAASDSANAGIRNIAGNPEASGSFNGGVSGSYIYRSDGVKRNNASSSSYGASFTTNDVIGVALDLDAGTLVFYKNGSSQGTAYSSLSGTFEPMVSGDQSSGTTSYAVNFGQRPFSYTAPSGFKALNTYNLP